AVISAVGSTQIVPPVPGVKGGNVCLAVDVDKDLVKPGKRVVLVGAGLTGSETAVSLARDGHEVTVVDMQSVMKIMARDKNIGKIHRMAQNEGVEFKFEMKLCEITEKSVILEGAEGKVELECDTVVLSLGVRPRYELIEQLRDICPETYIVGDCNNRAGNITSAVREGFYAAMNI
ncbi:MAG: FAD-dependent oxidoreductase, partial [Oscillospiraceae bacterium]|nr:FAD-dependent oxidoreductase [Oscillospiraceae bacterium]